jgi:hypothetical protein
MATLVGATDGSVKGDDAFFHMANARFLSDNFPFVWWSPGPHSGEAGLLIYPLAYYAVLGGLDRLSIDLGLALKMTLLAGISSSGIAVYWLARRFDLDRVTATGLAVMLATCPMVWNWAVVGGAYIRLAALPFACAAIGCAYLRVADGSRSIRSFLFLIVSMGATAVIHPLLFQFAGAICATILFLGTPGWLARVGELVKVAVGVGAIVAWQYIPMMNQVLRRDLGITEATAHDTTTMRGVWLFIFPQRGEWSITLGPVLFAVACVSLVFLAAYLPQLRQLKLEHRAEWAFLLTMVGWSVYFGLFAWTDIPNRLYLMAAYDHVLWLSITLTFTALAICARVVAIWPSARTTVGRPLLVLSLSSALAIMPWLQSFVSEPDPETRSSYSYAAQRTVERAIDSSAPGYRLGAANRTFSRWLPWSHPELEYLGGRSGFSPNRHFFEWMLYDVFFRTAGEEFDSVYFEDRPRVVRLPLEDQQNLYSALFFLEWFGVDQVLLDPPFSGMNLMAQIYEARPQFFTTKNVTTRFGQMKIASPREAQPITVATRAPLIAVPFADERSVEPYRALLELLSSLGLGPGIAVPVSLDAEEGLSEADVAVVDADTFVRHRSILTSFAMEGGRLVITFDDSRSVTGNVTLASGSKIRVSASNVEGVAESFARAGSAVIGGCSAEGVGEICRLGVSLPTLAGSHDIGATLLLLEALDLQVSLDRHAIETSDLKVTYSTPRTDADVSLGNLSSPMSVDRLEDWRLGFALPGDVGEVSADGRTTVLTADFEHTVRGQVTFVSTLMRSLPTDVPGFMSFKAETGRTLRIGMGFRAGDRFIERPVMLRPGTHEYAFPLGSLLRGSGLRSIDEVVMTLRPGFADQAVVRIVGASLRYWAEPGDDAVVLTSLDPRDPHNQVNVGASISRDVAVDERGAIRFRLYNDASTLKDFTVIAGDSERRRFLERIFAKPSRWSGWRSFSVPLASLARKGDSWPRTIESVDLIFNFSAPYGRERERAFAVSDMELTTVTSSEDVSSVSGSWSTPTLYRTDLGPAGSTLVWKENHTPTWRASREGRRMMYRFAGPGMVALPEWDGGRVQIEQSVPDDLARGVAASLVLGLALVVLLTTEARRGRKLQPPPALTDETETRL